MSGVSQAPNLATPVQGMKRWLHRFFDRPAARTGFWAEEGRSL
jgi:hypothetical protein